MGSSGGGMSGWGCEVLSGWECEVVREIMVGRWDNS